MRDETLPRVYRAAFAGHDRGRRNREHPPSGPDRTGNDRRRPLRRSFFPGTVSPLPPGPRSADRYRDYRAEVSDEEGLADAFRQVVPLRKSGAADRSVRCAEGGRPVKPSESLSFFPIVKS